MEEVFHFGIKALIRNRAGHILVLQNNPTHASGLNPPHWDLPGGRVHKGDSIEQTLYREIEEEIGIEEIKVCNMVDVSISKVRVPLDKTSAGLILMTFLCSIKNPDEIRLTDDEHIQFKWVPPQKAAQLLAAKFSDSFIKKVKKL